MAFRFRIRWRLERGRKLEHMNAASSARLATDWAECELKEVAPATRHGGQSLSLRSRTFATPEMAQEAGTRAQAALLLLAARAGFGVTLAARVPGGVITAYGKQILGQGRFDNILDDQYGLTVFEDNGRTGFASMGESSATVSQSALSFFDDWRSALSADPQADARVDALVGAGV